MATQSFKSLLHRWCERKYQTPGFTLIELLVSLIIASIIISSLLYLVVHLLQINQKESAQTETQRDMQMALDFIAAELREAVYIYGGECLQGQGQQTDPNYCPGIINYVPNPDNSVPILAFWKLDPLPDPLKTLCINNSALASVPCTAGRTYTLVVYFLRKNQSTDTTNWLGKARITRYALTQYDSNGNTNTSYANPDQPGVNFQIWPFKNNAGTLTNLQTSQPTDDATTLVDFVDDTTRTGDSNTSCPNNYILTPTTTTAPFNDVRSFYACVRKGTAQFNQDAFIFLRGNARGRAGINDDSYLPTLQTQILRRGTLNKIPSPLSLHNRIPFNCNTNPGSTFSPDKEVGDCNTCFS